ncbi:hypothetical protein Q6332_29080, partial [Klebsiella pneumoniae]|nr:hypothetical protein [Klebsiella pneumoniae]
RASGIGLAVAASRFGSAVATFLLPIAVQQVGVHAALGVCVGVLIIGGVVCHVFAPETSQEDLSGVTYQGFEDVLWQRVCERFDLPLVL